MEEKQNGRRSLSPYHEKCFPPYCDSAQQVDRAALSKMARGDLEEKYIIFADENLELKKQNRNHERQIQRLQTAIQRQDYLDKRSGKSPTSRVIDSNQIANLEAQNKNLQAKVKVLKQQLMNHSFIHSKDSRIAEAKKQGKSPRESSEYQTPTQTQSAREAKPDRNVAALKIKVAELENALETQKNKYKARIAQLEKELTALEKEAGKSGISINEQLSETSRQVKDNTELIRLRMQAEKQAAELEELRGKLEAANAEIEKLRRELKDGKDRADDLENDLARERNKSRTALSEASKGTTHMETIRALEEQIRDLQKERDTLKDTNEKLLQLTQSKSEKSLVKATSGHDIIIAQLERSLKDKMKELEEKEARIRELEQTPNQENVTYQTIAQLERSLKVKIEELEEKEARIRELEQTPNQEKVTCQTLSENVVECGGCNTLKRQLCGALIDNQRLQEALEDTQVGKVRSRSPLTDSSNTELNNLRYELERSRDEVSRLRDMVERLRDENDRVRGENKRMEIQLYDAIKELDILRTKTSEYESELNKLREEVEWFREEVKKLLGMLERLRDENDRVKGENKRMEIQLFDAIKELDILRPIAAEHESCKRPPPPQTSSKSIQYLPPSVVSFKEPQNTTVEQHPSVHSQCSDDFLKKQNQRLEDELTRALQELRELRPIVEEHRRCGDKIPPRKEMIVPEFCREYVKEVAPAPVYQISKVLSKASSHPSKPITPVQSKAPSAYISHVTPPPSTHCLETMKVNDEQQRANMLIVSKHDFENVLMQKKRYSTEVEMVEPIDGQQVLNCKMEICMYDLDLQDGMVEYLSSIEKEPKVYVEWSFVGLDQRTAPLPANQALFYTNVMYFGPLSSEIKNYLNKVEMPIYLYLVKSSGPPMRVAQGTLDILPAMEQPNRGFMRSVFLQGVDIPNRYSNNKSVGAIHCSFILHECCLGDPPFRDQLEVAIGTLYLKNRDGGVVPDHATHIYIEYALLGHCGPDLETDSVPRGEVMKFNHSKKLRVNDENAQHLKAMLEDENPRPLRFTVLAEPCNLLSESEVETVGHADVNLNEQMIRRNQDLISSQVPVYSNEGEHLGTLSVTVLGVGTLQQLYADRQR